MVVLAACIQVEKSPRFPLVARSSPSESRVMAKSSLDTSSLRAEQSLRRGVGQKCGTSACRLAAISLSLLLIGGLVCFEGCSAVKTAVPKARSQVGGQRRT